MKKLISLVKSIELNRIFMLFLAGVLVLFSTACSRPDTLADKLPGNPGPNTPGQTQSYKGGMNNFSDDDSNRLNTEAATKAKALKDKVQSRIKQNSVKGADDLADNVRSTDPGKQAQRFGDNLRDKAEDVKDSLQTVGDRGAKNLQRNAENASDNAANTLDNAVDAVKDKA
jgi:hypothetical protein